MNKDSKKFDPAIIEAEENLLIDYQFLVQELMVKKNVSRADLAEAAGLSKARLSQLLGPEANPTIKTMARLIHALGEKPVVSSTKVDARSQRALGPVREVGWAELASNDNFTNVFLDNEFITLSVTFPEAA